MEGVAAGRVVVESRVHGHAGQAEAVRQAADAAEEINRADPRGGVPAVSSLGGACKVERCHTGRF